jgi:hypothetical protein
MEVDGEISQENGFIELTSDLIGIHFWPACSEGLEQGKKIGELVTKLKMRSNSITKVRK